MKTLTRIFLSAAVSLAFIYANATDPIRDSLSLLKANYPAVHQSITSEFKNITNFKYTAAGGFLHVAFNDRESKTTAVFSCDGKRRYVITESAACMPATVKAMIETTYPRYSIFAAKEIKTADATIYQAVIENKYEYRLINIANEEIEEQKKTKKTL